MNAFLIKQNIIILKYFIYLLLVIAIGLIIYNTTHIDFDNLLIGNSKTAVISIVASACVVVLLLILITARSIQEKKNKKR